ncbi:serine hydrolase domain-containing protein [Aurantiacibacter sp. D1-12]|uniref:serine hydrolase domain-containing protein n=1 Tax=Aurantiacibacter sp. D1-12 TaxID=2993658 RepID=UPI00237C75E1|nr:serine hydrolase domain-containing protein [Aurantiacibacter sp. D1-12]MDE1467351.1 serine hydrolase [Aurantiacibacter sp. D1-12]
MQNAFAATLALALSMGATIGDIPVRAQAVDSQMEARETQLIEQIADNFIAQGRLEAVSIGVVHNGRSATVHAGPLYRDGPETANDRTIFELRSITKTFIGTLAAQAILDENISLNTDIREYLGPGFDNLERDGQPILVRHLLTHTSGLPSNNPLPANLDQPAPGDDAGGIAWRTFRDVEMGMTREKFFANLRGFELASVPGQEFNYSNLGTNLTALILERVYDRSLDELVAEFITGPAGMNDTVLAMTEPDALARLASGYNERGERIDPWPVWPMGGAEGAAKAPLPDTIRYMQFHLSERNPAVRLSHVPLHELAWDYRIASFWWNIDRPAGSTSFRHDGGYANVRNVMILFPEEDMGIYVVTNRVNPEANEILTEMVHIIRSQLLSADDADAAES